MEPGQSKPVESRVPGRREGRREDAEDAAWHGGKQPGGSGWGRQLQAPSRAGLRARSWLCAARSSLFWKGGALAERWVCVELLTLPGNRTALIGSLPWLQPAAKSAPALAGIPSQLHPQLLSHPLSRVDTQHIAQGSP